MTRPTHATGRARVHVYDRDGVTSRGVLAGEGMSWTHGKSMDGSTITFTGSDLEAAYLADPSMLIDALAVIEVDIGSVWTPVGTPYLLPPGQGTVVGEGSELVRENSPTGVGALALTAEWLVLHSGGEVNRRGPQQRYIGWQSADFDDSTWTASPVVSTSSFVITDPKYREPVGWPSVADAADWLKGDGTDAVVLYRFGSFVVTTARKYIIGFSCDEESKVYLDGPGWGGVIIESSEQETGYMVKNLWSEVLQPGTYYLSGEMTTVFSAGGDGFDGVRFYVATVDSKGRAATVVLMSDSACLVHNVTKTETRPGFTAYELVEKLRAENETWGIPSASLLDVVSHGSMPAGEEHVFDVGTPVAQVLGDLEVDVSFDVDTAYHLGVYADRGSDLSATVVLTPGGTSPTAAMNITDYGYTSDPILGTRAVVLTNDGFVEVIGTAEEALVDARGMFLESGSSGSIGQGRKYALDAIAQSGVVRHNYTAEHIGVTGAIPEVDFTVCDVIAALNYQRDPADLQVLSIGGANTDTFVDWSLDLGAP